MLEKDSEVTVPSYNGVSVPVNVLNNDTMISAEKYREALIKATGLLIVETGKSINPQLLYQDQEKAPLTLQVSLNHIDLQKTSKQPKPILTAVEIFSKIPNCIKGVNYVPDFDGYEINLFDCLTLNENVNGVSLRGNSAVFGDHSQKDNFDTTPEIFYNFINTIEKVFSFEDNERTRTWSDNNYKHYMAFELDFTDSSGSKILELDISNAWFLKKAPGVGVFARF